MDDTESRWKRRCPAMANAGIEDPDSTEGILFCAGTRDGKVESQCPYLNCVVFESSKKTESAQERATFARQLHEHGVSTKDIALIVSRTKSTVFNYIRHGRLDKKNS